MHPRVTTSGRLQNQVISTKFWRKIRYGWFTRHPLKGDLWRQSWSAKSHCKHRHTFPGLTQPSTTSASEGFLSGGKTAGALNQQPNYYQQHMTLHSIPPLRSCLRCNASFQLDISLCRRVLTFKAVNMFCAERQKVLNPCCHWMMRFSSKQTWFVL